MVKPLSFKGDKKIKKRKREAKDAEDEHDAPASKSLIPADAAPEDDENWVSADSIDDIAGPVMLVLPSKTVSCIACDQLGKVFTSEIENMVENEPSTAEPHDVRQVWISQKIVGSSNKFTFKGHHGKYLGCDKYGFLSSTREAVSPEETFTLTASEAVPGTFDISAYERFVSVDEDGEVRGDAETASEKSAVRIRMQARFKPKHKEEKKEKVRAKISRKELEAEVGRRLEDDEVKRLKKARREGNYHEEMLDVKVKGKHDKFA
ncbi:Protein frg1 [Pseudocercospora fuligena]|uniref:Protein frg1 n=1 Tax=Pseudocercospora fuligena TaxID=685502 RepID=A0A8H6RG82_9PEZI|nr:Protein frg1 [Pseudocercospora fuligena]